MLASTRLPEHMRTWELPAATSEQYEKLLGYYRQDAHAKLLQSMLENVFMYAAPYLLMETDTQKIVREGYDDWSELAMLKIKYAQMVYLRTMYPQLNFPNL